MKLTIGKKLFLGFGALVIIMLVLVVYSMLKLSNLRTLQDQGASRADAAVEAQHARRMGYKLYKVIADAQLNGYNAENRATWIADEKEADEMMDLVDKISDTKEEDEWARDFRKNLEQGITIFKNQMVPLFSQSGKPEIDRKISELDTKIDEAFAASQPPMRSFSESLSKESVEADKLFDSTAKAIVEGSIILAIIGLILAAIIAVIITRGITTALNGAVTSAEQIAKGNLLVVFDTKALDTADETGKLTRAMKEMADKLKETISFSLEASENVASGSDQLSASSQMISQGTAEQAASVEEISSSIEEMTSSINQNADNANQTEKIAMKSSADAKEGGEAVQKTVSAMKQIAEKISIIQEIARQTNLLSLNASIEAARAGEHGKGFAVVASAVQKLAERSQDAAEEISKLSKSSVDVAEKAGEMLSKLVPDIQKTAELVAEINAASAEQNKGAQQINTAIQQFNQVVQSNASSAEELASTAEELSSQAEELKDRISFFKVSSENRERKSAQTRARMHSNVHAASKNQKAIPHISHFSSKESASQKGVALNMGDDDDNQFQRV